MAEYIEREALLRMETFMQDEDGFESSCVLSADIRRFPAADVVERKRGRWVLGNVEPGYCTPGGNRPWVCSECGRVESWHLDKPKTKFCGECGADMREVDDAN